MNLKNVLAAMLITILTFTAISVDRSFALTNSETEPEIEPTAEEYVISDDDPDAQWPNISTRSIRSCVLNFKRVGNTKAIATLEALSSINSSSMTSTIYLQKYNADTNKYVNVKGMKRTKSSKTSPIKHAPSFAVSKNGKYRIKAVVSDESRTLTKYKVLT